MPQEHTLMENFAMVAPGIYRSSFPRKKHFAFLKVLKLKTILTLVQEDYPEANKTFCKDNDIQLIKLGMAGNKEPFVDIDVDKIRKAVTELLDIRNHPILIHCNKGKHRTGCLIGALRKVCRWSLCSILEEYIRFSTPKQRFMDQQFIELFDPSTVKIRIAYIPDWLPCSREDFRYLEDEKGSTAR